MQKRNLRTGRLLWLGCAVILIGVPFHAFFTAWFASRFGYFDLIRLWKEFILLAMSLSCVYQVVRHPALRKDIKVDRLSSVIILFIGFFAVMAVAGVLAGDVSLKAALYGLIIDTRPFLFLMVLMVAGRLSPLPKHRWRWILIPAVVVVVFGLMQLFVLPANFLSHFGYGAHTLSAFQPVDNKPDIARVQSTLRGPNPLGAYLVPVIMTFIALAAVSKKRRVVAYVLIAGALVVLFGSYSRSAAIGLILGVFSFIYWSIRSVKVKRLFLIVTASALLVGGGLVYMLRNNDTFQNIAFHTDEKSTSAVSSNTARFSAIRNGVNDVVRHPLGSGVGSAGPASIRNTRSAARISENFYLQIGQEAGVLGLFIFLMILWLIIHALYVKRSDVYVRAALASLIGLLFINFVSHAWADDTLAYVSFALIGFAIIKTSTKSENLAKL